MYLAQDKTLLATERLTVKLRKPRTVEMFQRCSLCFAQPPVYGGPQLSHQNKMLTSNSNDSHQIQITHSKLKITHSKFKLLTANYKSLTANYKQIIRVFRFSGSSPKFAAIFRALGVEEITFMMSFIYPRQVIIASC